jgi:aspartate kinase
MIVLKFGGTSVEDASSIERVVDIIRARVELRPVVVVSAMGKTTRMLLQAAEASAAGERKAAINVVDELKSRHQGEAGNLVSSNDGQALASQLNRYFDELKTLLEGLAILGEVPPRGLDKILSYGELLSSTILAAALVKRGVQACLLDAREFIKTDNRYGAASPFFELTNRKVNEAIRPAIERGLVPVTQGFIGSTREGATTTLGFEGSDYTATIIGAAIGAEDIQIWKDVSGLMTADPAIFAGARTVKACSYAEAGELTYFGAKVLHPKAVHPAAHRNIPVHIYNSKQPAAPGTAITATAPACHNLIKSIAYKRPVTILRARGEAATDGSQALTPDDFLRSIVDAMRRRRIQPLLAVASALSVAAALDSGAIRPEVERDLIDEIRRTGGVNVQPDMAIVTIVGEELRDDHSFAGRVLKAVGDTEFDVILHGSSPIAMNFVVAQTEVETIVARLHDTFFEELDREVFE